MRLFFTIFSIIVLQRLVELIIAKRNERIMKENGAIEYGQEHYVLIVFVHIAFFVSLTVEVMLTGFQLTRYPVFLFGMFLLLQAIRVWTIASLGRHWNTKIILLPGAEVVQRGPYRFLRHPNYVVVMFELIVFPLLFNAFYTAVLFSILNYLLLRFIRIPAEERALISQSDYLEHFSEIPKFTPRTIKKTH